MVNHAVSPDRYILRTAETEIAVLFSVCLTHNTRLLSWLETFLTLYNFNKFVNQSVGRDVKCKVELVNCMPDQYSLKKPKNVLLFLDIA